MVVILLQVLLLATWKGNLENSDFRWLTMGPADHCSLGTPARKVPIRLMPSGYPYYTVSSDN